MSRRYTCVIVGAAAVALLGAAFLWAETEVAAKPELTKLPEPALAGAMSVEEAISRRRSVRSFSDEALTMQQVSQLLWAAQGITEKSKGLRSAPSAMAIYPLTVYAVMKDAAYKYVPAENALEKVKDGDLRAQLAGQRSVASAPVSFVIAGDYDKMAGRFAKVAHTFTDFEAGAAAENLFIQAVAMGLASVPVGGMDAAKVAQVLGCPANETVIIVIPVGKPAK